MYVSDALSRLKSAEKYPVEDVIPLNFVQHTADTLIYHQYSHLFQDVITDNAHRKTTRTSKNTKRKTQTKNNKSSKTTTAKSTKSNSQTKSDKKTPKKGATNHKRTAADDNIPINTSGQSNKHARKQQNAEETDTALTRLVPPQSSILPSVVDSTVTTGSLLPGTSEITTTIRDPPDNIIREAQPLFAENEPLTILRRHIPKQNEIDKILSEINAKVLHQITFPAHRREIATAYKTSHRFKDVHAYILHGTLPNTKVAQSRLKAEAQNYVIINDILFRINLQYNVSRFKELPLQVVIPEEFQPLLFHTYHNSLLAGHQGIWRTYLTIRTYFFVINLLKYLKEYIKACHICQKSARPKAHKNVPTHARIPIDYRPMERISCDIKYMPKGFDGFEFLLVVTCEMTNFTIAIPLKGRTAEVIAEALLHRVVAIFGIPKLLLVDQDAALTGKVIKALTIALGCQLKVISPYNHGSSKTERQIQTISNIINKRLDGKGTSWPLFAACAAYAANTFQSETLSGLSPFELVFLRKPPDLMNLSIPDISGFDATIREYLATLMQKAQLMKEIILDFRTTQAQIRQQTQSRYQAPLAYQKGQLVYLLAPHASTLQTGTTKFRQDFVGPLVVDEELDSTHFKLRDLSNRVLPDIYHINRLKAANVLIPHGSAATQQELIKAHGQLKQCALPAITR